MVAGGGAEAAEPREPRRASKISKGRRLSTVEVGVSIEGGRVTLDRMPQNLLSTNYISYLVGGGDGLRRLAEVWGALPTVRSRLENGFPSPSGALRRAAGAVRAASARVRASSGAVRVPSKVGNVICT